MDIKDLVKSKIDEIKKLVFADEQQAAFAERSLSDGTQVQANPAMEVGAEFLIVKDGVPTPAESGEYELADGSKVMVEDGKIKEIVAVEAVVDEEMKNEFSKIADSINSKIAEISQSFTAQIDALKTELQTANEAFAASKEQHSKEVEVNYQFKKEVFALLQKIVDAPAAQAPAQHQFTQTKKDPSFRNEVDELVSNYLTRTK